MRNKLTKLIESFENYVFIQDQKRLELGSEIERKNKEIAELHSLEPCSPRGLSASKSHKDKKSFTELVDRHNKTALPIAQYDLSRRDQKSSFKQLII